eukprot:1935351-Rhodomonas_salina.1
MLRIADSAVPQDRGPSAGQGDRRHSDPRHLDQPAALRDGGQLLSPCLFFLPLGLLRSLALCHRCMTLGCDDARAAGESVGRRARASAGRGQGEAWGAPPARGGRHGPLQLSRRHVPRGVCEGVWSGVCEGVWRCGKVCGGVCRGVWRRVRARVREPQRARQQAR